MKPKKVHKLDGSFVERNEAGINRIRVKERMFNKFKFSMRP